MQQLLRLDYFCFMWSFTKGTSYERCPCLRTWCSSKSRMTVMLVDTDRKRWSKVISMLRRTAWMQTQRQGMISNWHVPAPDNNKIMKYYSCLQDRETHTHTHCFTHKLRCLVRGLEGFWKVFTPNDEPGIVWFRELHHSNRSIGHALHKHWYSTIKYIAVTRKVIE